MTQKLALRLLQLLQLYDDTFTMHRDTMKQGENCLHYENIAVDWCDPGLHYIMEPDGNFFIFHDLWADVCAPVIARAPSRAECLQIVINTLTEISDGATPPPAEPLLVRRPKTTGRHSGAPID